MRQSLGQVYVALNKQTGQEVIVKLIERGPTVSKHVENELLLHRQGRSWLAVALLLVLQRGPDWLPVAWRLLLQRGPGWLPVPLPLMLQRPEAGAGGWKETIRP